MPYERPGHGGGPGKEKGGVSWRAKRAENFFAY